jgi:hypothetical protein
MKANFPPMSFEGDKRADNVQNTGNFFVVMTHVMFEL